MTPERKKFLISVAWVFVYGFLSGAITAYAGLGPITDKATAKAAVVGLIVGGLGAAFKAVKAALNKNESPFVGSGVMRSP